jgi:hypothetical protein
LWASRNTQLSKRMAYGDSTRGSANAKVSARPLFKRRAEILGAYPISSITWRTRERVSGATPGSLLTTRETVLIDVWATAATSFIVGDMT